MKSEQSKDFNHPIMGSNSGTVKTVYYFFIKCTTIHRFTTLASPLYGNFKKWLKTWHGVENTLFKVHPIETSIEPKDDLWKKKICSSI